MDVAVFHRFGFLGAGILTAVTAQSSRRISEVRCLGGKFVLSQYETLRQEISPTGIKVGMLGGRRNIPALVQILGRHPDIPIVVDPVFRSTSGRWLLERDAVPQYLSQIKGRMSILTPNLLEAALISGRRPRNPEEMKESARLIFDRIGTPCLVKGGHLARQIVDVFYDGFRFALFPHKKMPGDVHGTGCFLSASLLCYLAQGKSVLEAAGRACEFTQAAIRKAVPMGEGRKILAAF